MADRSCAIDGKGHVAGMVHPRHLVGIFHHMFNLIIEPDINRLVHQAARDEGKQHRGNQSEADEGRDQFRAKSRTHKAVTPLKIGFDQISREQQSQNDKPDEVQIDQQQHEGVAGAGEEGIGLFAAGDDSLRIVHRQGQAGQKENENDPDRSEMRLAGLTVRLGFCEACGRYKLV